MLTPENIVVLRASVLSASRLLIFATSLSSFCEHIVVNYNIVDWKQVWGANKKSRSCDLPFCCVHPTVLNLIIFNQFYLL